MARRIQSFKLGSRSESLARTSLAAVWVLLAGLRELPAFQGLLLAALWRLGAGAGGLAAVGAERLEPMGEGVEGFGLEAVVHPAALLAIGQQAGLLQHLEVERQLRLAQPQLGGKVADAAFVASQGLDHLEAQGVGKGLEQGPGSLGFDLGRCDDVHGRGNTLSIKCG